MSFVHARVKGLDRAMYDLARTAQAEKSAIRRGTHLAAMHLLEKMKSKFGSYQSTGGTGGGAWAKLKFETNKKKLRKYGFSGRPLIGSGAMQDSLYIRDPREGSNVLISSVGSNSPYMIHHVYGAPRRNVPPRDLMLVTAMEEKDECRNIIIEQIWSAYK